MSPPYWPFQCKRCCRYVSKPRVTYNCERIVREIGNCSRCGDDVELVPLCWEDWFGWDFDPYDSIMNWTAAS